MEPSSKRDNTPTTTQTARLDLPDGEALQWRIIACLRTRDTRLKGIHVSVRGNTAAIQGTVRSPRDKRIYLECCRHVPGVMRVVDELVVAVEATDDEGPVDANQFVPTSPAPR